MFSIIRHIAPFLFILCIFTGLSHEITLVALEKNQDHRMDEGAMEQSDLPEGPESDIDDMGDIKMLDQPGISTTFFTTNGHTAHCFYPVQTIQSIGLPHPTPPPRFL